MNKLEVFGASFALLSVFLGALGAHLLKKDSQSLDCSTLKLE
tara:strand:+ start:523 stop:648 length:126 start_codon:yes stop_codon:yes gene_type:complete